MQYRNTFEFLKYYPNFRKANSFELQTETHTRQINSYMTRLVNTAIAKEVSECECDTAFEKKNHS